MAGACRPHHICKPAFRARRNASWLCRLTLRNFISGSVHDGQRSNCRLGEQLEGAAGDIGGDAKAEAAGRVREATGTAQNLDGQAKDAAREVTDAAAGYAKDAYENSGDTFRDGSQATAKKVQDNPLGSMLIAGAIGFALALLMTRSARRSPQRWR